MHEIKSQTSDQEIESKSWAGIRLKGAVAMNPIRTIPKRYLKHATNQG